MRIRSSAARGATALAALVLLTSTVLAADPSASPSGSPDAAASSTPSAVPSRSPSASVGTPASPSASAGIPAAASTAPSAAVQSKESESPEASEAPEAAQAPEAPPSADEIARIVGRLNDAGINATAAQVTDLAGKVGVGGAVRVFAFAQASGKTPAQIMAMRQAGKGWGQIKHELNLSIGPGIGWIMGNGHGQGHNKPPKP